jgi:hypothetical protein
MNHVSANKIGRNDPCPCGSGKKYKKCCVNLVEGLNNPPALDAALYQLRQLEHSVMADHLVPYAADELPYRVSQAGMDEFFPESLPDDFDVESCYENFFAPWLFFNWVPGDSYGVVEFDPDMTISQNYMRKYGGRLNKNQKIFIEEMNKTYFSFYRIVEVELDQYLIVKDLLLGTTHKVKERRGTHCLQPGQIVYGRLLTMKDQTIFLGLAPMSIPDSYAVKMVDYKNLLIKYIDDEALTPHTMRHVVPGMLNILFFTIIEELYNKPQPIVKNSDGELMEFSTSTFDLQLKPEEAFYKLTSLTFKDEVQDFLNQAKKTKSGDYKEIKFPWMKLGNKMNKAWDNTILGNITITSGKLTLETNSTKRATTGKKKILKLLGDKIVFVKNVIDPMDSDRKNSLIKNTQVVKKTTKKNNQFPSHEDIMADPELLEGMKEIAKVYWQSWFDEPIPLLNDQTPREAAKTKEGRERLEALLDVYVSNNAAIGPGNPFRADIPSLKKELGLD